MGFKRVKCEKCKRKMLVGQNPTDGAREPPYYCSRKSCKNEKTIH